MLKRLAEMLRRDESYLVISAKTPQGLQNQVNAQLAQGWRLHGGPTMAPFMDQPYTQAMRR